MANGTPDYMVSESLTHSLQYDISQLVMALGGVQSIDGLGRPIYIDDFRGGINNWFLSWSGSGAIPRKGTTYQNSYLSGLGCEFVLGADPASSMMSKRFGNVAGGRMGIEVMPYPYNTPGDFIVDVNLTSLAGVNYRCLLTMSSYDGVVRISTTIGDVTIVSFDAAVGFYESWYPTKIVVDLDTGKYVRLIFGRTAYDLSAYYMVQSASDYIGRAMAMLKAQTNGVFQGNYGLGYFILTLDEP